MEFHDDYFVIIFLVLFISIINFLIILYLFLEMANQFLVFLFILNYFLISSYVECIDSLNLYYLNNRMIEYF